MKKFYLILLLTFISFSTNALQTPVLISNSQKEENKKYQYSVDISYPQIKNATAKAQINFNKIIKDFIQKNLNAFISDARDPDNVTNCKSLGCTYSINYDATTTNIYNRNIISVRLFTSTDAYGSHAQLFLNTFNYDYTNARILALSDLFSSDPNYLNKISEVTQKSLMQQLKDSNWEDVDGESLKEAISEATNTDVKNFSYWNVVPQGLRISFDASQLKPIYFTENQYLEVTIPFKSLK